MPITEAVPALPRFDQVLRALGLPQLSRGQPETLQVNVGKLCNQACHHCHVDAGPARREIMNEATARRVIGLLQASRSVRTVDLTGGAPELNPFFRLLVAASREADREVIVRCNLTVLFVPGMEWLPEFYRDYGVRLVCSLPCYGPDNVTKQRGAGVFEKSIDALRLLNRMGFGTGRLRLDLAYNPVGPSLPPPQAALEAEYRQHLSHDFGISFDRLLTITNMPISRFAAQLHREGRYDEYMGLLVNHFNPATVDGLMCRTLVSVGWDGGLYDCDFNQMLSLPLLGRQGRAVTLDTLESLDELSGAAIVTGAHCFGCTAGAGSSCGGTLT
ncbi:MAG TPA: arsenosugar biosynthesis radical SAM (seleno)protein ArsS [Candidatus Binataceae bacterium]|nr:arsenosugar biosynthesis radical SAM (seleno)protein ArsS [Candidatus Binataceae bacterium]